MGSGGKWWGMVGNGGNLRKIFGNGGKLCEMVEMGYNGGKWCAMVGNCFDLVSLLFALPVPMLRQVIWCPGGPGGTPYISPRKFEISSKSLAVSRRTTRLRMRYAMD